jgi:hypothetical protein
LLILDDNDDGEKEDSNCDPSNEECDDLDELLDESVEDEDADPEVNVESEIAAILPWWLI